MLVGWGFGSPELTLYTYRALESILHVYPGARVKVITIGKTRRRAGRQADGQIDRQTQTQTRERMRERDNERERVCV